MKIKIALVFIAYAMLMTPLKHDVKIEMAACVKVTAQANSPSQTKPKPLPKAPKSRCPRRARTPAKCGSV